jgi:hypothetical protein
MILCVPAALYKKKRWTCVGTYQTLTKKGIKQSNNVSAIIGEYKAAKDQKIYN